MTPRRISLFASLISIIVLTVNILLPSPAFAINISVAPASGTAGSQISITGEGYIGKMATIYWDGKKLIQNVPISKAGQINYTFEAPQSAKGEHTIKVTDDSNWADITASTTFIITPSVSTDPSWGKIGIPILLSGSGFLPGETKIKPTLDGKPLSKLPLSADKTGTWYTVFDVPYLPKGEYILAASGEITQQSEMSEILFTIGPFCKAKPLSGPVGTKVTITGVGFRPGEDGVTITWDGPITDMNFVAEPNGNFNCTITVPPSVKGKHVIGVYGSSFTPRGIIPDIGFEVTPQIELTPREGNKGTTVKINGTGFNSGESVTVTYDKADTGITAVTDSSGSFMSTFQIPFSPGKEHTITATGNKGASAEAVFSATKGTPTAPQLLSPGTGARLQVFNSVLDIIMNTFQYLGGLGDYFSGSDKKVNNSALTTMTWSAADDPSELTYNLQISRSNDFSAPVFHKENISSNSYLLARTSLPNTGIYYWRVKAVDDTGVEGPWSNAWKFEIVSTSPLVIAMSVTILILVIAIIVFAVLALISRNRY
ncbi:MAG: hypothetical protein NT082_06130 [Chloroflexi bacterium]|nr:hypothetical protein [Chloroflexota bacterium]